MFFRRKKKLINCKRRPWKRKYDQPTNTWVGLILLKWKDADDTEYDTYVTLFESFDGKRFVEYSISKEIEKHKCNRLRHLTYVTYVVPWLHGIDIHEDAFHTYNIGYDAITKKAEKPKLLVFPENKIKDR